MIAQQNPRLAAKARRYSDPLSGDPLLLFPEGVLRLNKSGDAIVALCDGSRSVHEIAVQLGSRTGTAPTRIEDSVLGFLRHLQRRRLLCWEELPNDDNGKERISSENASLDLPLLGARPLGLLAELTYGCPLKCPYCSNPTTISPTGCDLNTNEWESVFHQAARLGVLHIHLSGGEPLLYREIVRLVATSRQCGLYTNLLTSGVGLTRSLAEELRLAGLDHVQISLQADQQALSDRIGGASVYAKKLAAIRLVKELGWPLTLNVILHRLNIDRVPNIIALAEELGADRLELANVQFYGWGDLNRDVLVPSRDELIEAGKQVSAARHRLRRTMEIVYVLSDSLAERPKACMGGWGNRQLTVNPSGDVLPCPNAGCIPSLAFENVRKKSLNEIWHDSEAFNRFRGTDWMPDPCRTCELREIDFGGCRCQAQLLTGDAANTDPACALSPHHSLMTRPGESAIEEPAFGNVPLIMRSNPSSFIGVRRTQL